MKGYKNLEELRKEWKAYGVQVNKKGELIAKYEGQEYKIGKVSFFDESGESVSQEEIEKSEKQEIHAMKGHHDRNELHENDTKRERERQKLKKQQ